ncbi:UDP-glucose/GDP-mannose dehydrogenase family protein [Motiliproteus coralliicola]|uniref:UDP-glucose 6-dehydrogenase n=1 Tax=Motiliproteus coralliicola TaxID=2283196 RepID=A0A369WRQ0_9GAMM|nr:nucleotide sugar dehydrogenase [Motiliproteus coralliicola]RDE24798.1 UDP-glucose/GDP-mannose dehydrogenase family protein [Motiliproteus coralliicola]
MRLSIFGLGYVGSVSLGCLAKDGNQVIGVDIDPVKLGLIADGKSPVIEEGMPELIAEAVASGRVSVTDDVRQGLMQSDISFICVGTPSLSNGDQNQTAILRLTEQLGEALKEKSEHHTLVFRSTLVPGTVEKTLIPMLESISGKQDGVEFDVGYQPEFLREGSSIKDYYNPPFTIIGASNGQAHERLRELYSSLPCQYRETSIATAETMKYFCNIFHAVKITFANEVARLCDGMEVDPHEVMGLLCEDKQLNISTAYMKPGFAFGGSCLPKDLRAMQYQAKRHDIEIPMLGHVLRSNEAHLDLALQKALAWKEQHGVRKVAMLGLSFKPGTDDLRESPLVMLAEQLIGKGMQLSVYDPNVSLSRLLGANKRFIENTIPHIGELMSEELTPMIEQADIVIVGQNHRDALTTLAQRCRSDQLILDLINQPQLRELDAHYLGLSW